MGHGCRRRLRHRSASACPRGSSANQRISSHDARRRLELAGRLSFADAAGDFLDALGNDPVVFHNAVFNTAVIDAELARAGMPVISGRVACTKKAFADMLGMGRPDAYVPGTSLGALCNLLDVDRSARTMHGSAVEARMTASCLAVLEPLGWMLCERARDQPHRRAGFVAHGIDETILRRLRA